MTDYGELVKTLRGKFIAYDVTGNHNSAQLYKDAADAIEALQAEIRQSMQRCAECGDELAQQLPKRGEWLNVTDSYSWYGKCSVCGEEFVVDAYYAGGMNYCPKCGAQMEVQE